MVCSAGQPVSRLLVVHTGRLKISRVSAGGREQVLRTAAAGDVIGEREFLTGHRPDHVVVAVEDSEMCTFDQGDLSALLGACPDIGARMLRTVSARLACTERLLAAVTSSDVTARIAAYLLDLPATVAGGVPTVALPMAKQDVAAHLGTTPETLSRRLAALVDAGVIALHGRRDVTIVDVGALEQAASLG